MARNISATLWRIGSSVVFTVPAAILRSLKENGSGDMLVLTFKKERENFTFLSRPWKCGGSHVATVPISIVEVFGLMENVKNKTPINVSVKVAPKISG